MALITPAEARELIPGLVGADDALTTVIARAEQAIASHCAWPRHPGSRLATLEAARWAIYLDGPAPEDAAVLRLPLRPVIEVESVHIDPRREWTGDPVDPDDYEVDEMAGEIILRPSARTWWPTGRRVIRVVAECGVDPDDVPQDLRAAVAGMARALWERRDTLGRSQVAQGGGRQESRDPDPRLLPRSIRELLQPWVLAERRFSGGPRDALQAAEVAP